MFLWCLIVFFLTRIPKPTNQVYLKDETSIAHFAYPYPNVSYSPRTHADENGAASKQSYLNTKWVEFRAVLISTRSQATAAHFPRAYHQHIQFSRQVDKQGAFPPGSSDISTHSSRKRKYSFLVSKTSTSWRMLECFTLRWCVKNTRQREKHKEREGEWYQDSYRRRSFMQLEEKMEKSAFMLINITLQ